MKRPSLLLALLLVGCTPQEKPPGTQTQTTPVQTPVTTPVQTPVTTPVQVTMVAPTPSAGTDMVPLAESIRFSGGAVVLAALIIAFGRLAYRALARARAERRNAD